MTWVGALAVLLIVLGVVYTLVSARWLPASRHGTSAALATEPAASRIAGSEPTTAAGLPRPLTLAWVEGTYLRTTMAISGQEPVTAAGPGLRARATMVVDDSAVRWEREGTADVRVAGPRLLGVSLESATAQRFPGQAHHVLVSWMADNGDHYVTGFRPRNRAEPAVLVSAVQRLMKIGVPIGDTPRTPDGTL